MTTLRHVVRDGDRTFEVAVEADGRITVAGAAWDARAIDASEWHLTSGNEQHVVHAVVDGETAWVHVDGDVHVLEIDLADRPRTRARSRHAADLTAPMPAVVRAVLVSPGDHVAAGDVLVMLEAMKMELPVRAPRSGSVASIRCRPGELVQPGIPLVELA